jgi:short-subunit dehydrogenase
MDTNRKTALITGASAGIGLAFAKIFAENGYDLVLVARNKEKLTTITDSLAKEFGIAASAIASDFAHANATEAIFNQTEERGIIIDVLVNNAGSGAYGPFADNKREDELAIIEINIVALVDLTHRYLQGMKSRRSGKILNIASTAAFQPGPLMAVYYASKSFVLSFSEALRNEVRESNIAVTALCPGPTKTDFTLKEPALTQSKLFKLINQASAESVALAG